MEPIVDIAIKKARAYAARHELLLVERLGFGVHGSVHVVEDKIKGDRSAIKAHRATEFFLRERAVYELLSNAGITEVLGFHVPQNIRADDELQVIEMTIVTRPFVVDFAGAYVGAPPEFSEEIWAEWETEKREQFGARWRTVQAVMGAFEDLGVHLVDVSPNNIAFLG
jgi:hypothetical protein